jgi:hypothetical protein
VESSELINRHNFKVGDQMKRHQVALIIALALLAAMASTSLVNGGLSAAALQDNPLESVSAMTPNDAMQSALQAASLIVRARVEQVASRWANDRSHLQSENTLTIRYVLRGAVEGPLVVYTTGGYLAEEKLTMAESESPTLTAGEEVILLLAPGRNGYTIVGRLDGKYNVLDQEVRYAGLGYVEPLDAFYARLTRLAPDVLLPKEWAKQEAILHQITPVSAADYIYNERKWPIGNVSFHVNLNSDKIDMGNGTADDFLAAILNGAMTWSMAPDAEFVLTYTGETETVAPAYDHTNNIFFIDKGLVDDNGVRRPLATATVWSSNGVILDADITVNDAYQWDATGQPERTEIDLESVVLHEFGHWLSLGHDSNNRAVMYYAITAGTLKRALFDNDQRGIGFIYPCAVGQACSPTTTVTPTPTASLTPTASPTPTVTPTATATPAIIPIITPTPVTRVVTHAAGGIVEYAPAPGAYVVLRVPPNAVITDTAVTLEQIYEAPAPPQNHNPVMPYFRIDIEPVGLEQGETVFQEPATLTITYSLVAGSSGWSDSMRLLTLDESSQSWVETVCEYAIEDGGAHRVTTILEQSSAYGLFRTENMLYLPITQR